VAGAGDELDGLVVDQDLDRAAFAGPGADLEVVLGKGDVEAVVPVMDAEAELLDLGW
jgi:hypothetical protein